MILFARWIASLASPNAPPPQGSTVRPEKVATSVADGGASPKQRRDAETTKQHGARLEISRASKVLCLKRAMVVEGRARERQTGRRNGKEVNQVASGLLPYTGEKKEREKESVEE